MEIENEEFQKIDIPKIKIVEKPTSPNKKEYNGLNTFQINEKNNAIKKEEKIDKVKIDKRFSKKYVFPRGIYFSKTYKKRVSITNLKELNQNRFEKVNGEILRRLTLNIKG